MNQRFQLICILVFAVLNINAQAEIDLHPKLLYKELVKSKQSELPSFEELKMKSGLSERVHGGKYYIIANPGSPEGFKYAYIGRINSCRAGGCSVHADESAGQASEYFDYFILFDAGCIVRLVRVFNYQATHGQEITAPGWLKQFIGYSGQSTLDAGKNVDAISGATISVTDITYDIEEKTKLLRKNMLE